MKNKRLIALFLFLTLSTILISGCGKKEDKEEQKSKKQVQIQEIKLQDEIKSTLTASGTVVPKQYAVIRSLTPGTVEYITPVGTKIAAGQSLFKIADSNIENNYLNSLQNFKQTVLIADEKAIQAQLSLNSAQAGLTLSERALENVKQRADQALANARQAAINSYRSAYNVVEQFYKFIHIGDPANMNFVYSDLRNETPQYQLFNDIEWRRVDITKLFIQLEPQPNEEDLNSGLKQMHDNLVETKNLINMLFFLLNDERLPSYKNSSGDRTIINTFQTQITQYTDGILATQNALANIEITNQLNIDQSKNQLELAQIQFENTQISLENAKNGAQLEKTIVQSQLDNAAYNYGNLSLASPFSGTIMSTFVEPGQQTSVGQEIIELGDLDIVEIEVSVDSEFAKNIKIGDKAQINDLYEGFISQIQPTGDIQSGKTEIKIQAENPDKFLTAGEIADISFELVYSQKDLIVIPIKSATIESTGTYVYVLEEGKSMKRSITLGKIFGDKVSVESGLQPGDKMILKNGVFISEGEEVEVE